MVVGEAKHVAVRLLELQDAAQVDEVVVVTPSLDRARRTASLQTLADAWRLAA
jgi:alkanesulfonate monooxygenase SsuD/methylene tetrahydromethanopterin reductase-like flavin-dependent oxidoreductase (luciferase family)